MQLVNGLNLEQKQAAISPNPFTLVVASAGTGKTSTIMARVEYLLHNGVLPQDIMLITFTHKASVEIKERLLSYFNEDTIGRISAGTFHAIALKHIQPSYKNLKILNNSQARVLVQAAYEKAGIGSCARDLGVQPVSWFQLCEYFSSFSSISTNYDSIQDYIMEKLSQKNDENYGRHPYALYEKAFCYFNDMKKSDNYFAFNDLLSYAIEFSYQIGLADYKHVIVDEYQDTNPLQESFIDSINPETLFCVGDYDQSIYSFNGADIGIISNFTKKYKDAAYYNLFRNYRSAPKILELAEKVVSLNPRIYPKELKAQYMGKVGNECPQYFVFETAMEQFQSIAAFISSVPLEQRNDMAILFRGNSSAAGIEIALKSLNIEYIRKTGSSFFERDDIQIILSCIKMANGEFQYSDLIVAYQDLFFSEKTKAMETFYENIKSSHFKSFDTAALGNKLSDKEFSKLNIKDFVALRKKCKNIKKPSTLISAVFGSKLFSALIKAKAFPPDKDTRQAEHQLNEKKEILLNASFPHKSINSFLNSLSRKNTDTADEESRKVNLMSVHASKGLEFDTVFLVDLTEKMFPNSRLVKAGGSIEEERRLFYVAVTRSKNTLWLCYPKKDMGDRKKKPSQFLIEAGLERPSM